MSREYVDKRLKDITGQAPPKRTPAKRRPAANLPQADPAPQRSGPGGEVPGTRMHVTGKFVYKCSSGIFDEPLRTDARCGEFLDRLLGVLAAKAPYIHPTDSSRYARLIAAFSGLSLPEPVPDLPLERLPRALSQWVVSTLETDPCSLAPSFALDAARFIEAHAYGRTFRSEQDEDWEILPLVSGFNRDWSDELDQDRGLKREITQGIAGFLVRARVPPGCRIRDRRAKSDLAGPGPIFVQIERCHLSQGLGVDYAIHLEVAEDAPLRHDVAREFTFLGRYWPEAAVAALQREGTTRFEYETPHKVYIPGRWIEAILRPSAASIFPPTLEWAAVSSAEGQ